MIIMIEKLTKRQLKKEVDSFPRCGFGPKSRLHTDLVFKKAFTKSIYDHGTNGSRIHADLTKQKFEIGYKTIHKYLRIIFGQYPVTGRPSGMERSLEYFNPNLL